MRINEHTQITCTTTTTSSSSSSTTSLILIPYLPQHVPTYHSWMQYPALLTATASDPLSLSEEYSMQRSWRTDRDKLTFIICAETKDRLVGDVNLFLTLEAQGDQEDERKKEVVVVIGEVEVMIAETKLQGMGWGRRAVVGFLMYIVKNEGAVLKEFLNGDTERSIEERREREIDYFRVKIGKENVRSIKLFESLGFVKASEEPNYFGEFELRHTGMSVKAVEEMMERYGVGEWKETKLEDGEMSNGTDA